ncbi:hypothetical protein MBLNU457_6392t1 [Dothideomycetes sp. NU457]
MLLKNATIYLGYGSNLWQAQMNRRCPTSEYLGVGRLDGYRWMINERGYANVVNTSEPAERVPASNVTITNISYGLVYSLQPKDEEGLDINEGVPIAYEKEYLSADFWPVRKDGKVIDVQDQPEKVDMLVYINRKQVTDSKPKDEYVYRMNMGIKDATKEGVPKEYVDKTMRPFIPYEDYNEVREVADQKALSLKDER